MPTSIIAFYHSVAPAGRPDPLGTIDRSVRVTAERFRGQMSILARRFSIVPLDTLLAQLREGRLRSGQACVTFDDGYGDNYEHAFPVLRRLGIPATIFLTTASLESGRAFWWERLGSYLSRRTQGSVALPSPAGATTLRWATPDGRTDAYDRLAHELGTMESGEERDRFLDTLGAECPPQARPLTWGETISMQRAGIAFGAHTHTHPSMPSLSDAALREEITRSRDLMAARLGVAPSLFAYPFGATDARTSRAVEDAGFGGAVTTEELLCSEASLPYWIPRIPVMNWDERAFVERLDKLMNRGFANKCKSVFKAVLPSAVAVGRGLRAARAGRRGQRPTRP